MSRLTHVAVRIAGHPISFLLLLGGSATVIITMLSLIPSPGLTIGARLRTTFAHFETIDRALMRDIVARRILVSGETLDGHSVKIDRSGNHVEVDRLLIPTNSLVSISYRPTDKTVEIRTSGSGATEVQLISLDDSSGKIANPQIDVLILRSVVLQLSAVNDQAGVSRPMAVDNLDFSVIEYQGTTSFASSALLEGKLQFFAFGYRAHEHQIDTAERVDFRLTDTVIESLRFAEDGLIVAFGGRPIEVVGRIGNERTSLNPSAFEGIVSVPPLMGLLAVLFGLGTAILGAIGFGRN